MERKTIKCNVCGGEAILIKTQLKHSRSGYLYKCLNCGASVGTHIANPHEPLGTLADSETKNKRRELHIWFDKLWRNHDERETYYQKLADELNIDRQYCHFAKMESEMLDKALEIVKKWWFEKYDH